MNLKENKFYQLWFKNAWTYVTGAILLSIFQIVMFATSDNPWGVSGTLANWGAWLYQLVGGSVDKWYYFSSPGAQAVL
ncbi:MAG: YeeE/YedE family protein, partial [Firmicutes bacterium HGW-Firmicutes-12]